MVKTFDEFINESNNLCKSPENTPDCLLEIVEFLNGINFKTSGRKDGRVASISDEEECIDMLRKSEKFEVVKESGFRERTSVSRKSDKILILVPSIRCWYDIKVMDIDGNIYYVNIKSSKASQAADDVGSLTSILYGMFGKTRFDKRDKPKQYNELFAEYNRHFKLDDFDKFENIDYYYLVIKKGERSFITSLNHFTKESIKPNGSNLPFQCKWTENTLKHNNKAYVCKIIMDTIYKSLLKAVFLNEKAIKEYGESNNFQKVNLF